MANFFLFLLCLDTPSFKHFLHLVLSPEALLNRPKRVLPVNVTFSNYRIMHNEKNLLKDTFRIPKKVLMRKLILSNYLKNVQGLHRLVRAYILYYLL